MFGVRVEGCKSHRAIVTRGKCASNDYRRYPLRTLLNESFKRGMDRAMPKDWKELTDDDLLNYEGPLTAQIARYDRIMAKKMHDALENVWGGLFDVKKAMHSSTEKIEKRLVESEKIQKDAAGSQTRLQRVTIALTVVIALSTVAYTWITWQSVQAQREANQIQREQRGAEANAKPIQPIAPAAR
jgi:preprotein translocase subunit SecG